MLNVYQFSAVDKTEGKGVQSDVSVFEDIARSYQKTVNGQEKIQLAASKLSGAVKDYLIAFADANKDEKVILEVHFCRDCLAEETTPFIDQLSPHFIIEPIFDNDVAESEVTELLQVFA